MYCKPEKLKKGDEIRIVAPSRSLKLIGADTRQIAEERFAQMGLKLSFGKNTVKETADMFLSSPAAERAQDIMDAFADKNVKAVFTVIGGFNSNEILDYIDFDIIKNNPKIFCGFSDITAISNAIHTMGNMITYYGPHYSSLGMKKGCEYTIEMMQKMLIGDGVVDAYPSKEWSDDAWFIDQENRTFIKNDGWWKIHDGKAKGTIEGGNISTFCLLNGTKYHPQFKEDTILFIEDCAPMSAPEFARLFQSLISLPDFKNVKGIAIGRFQKGSNVSREQIEYIVNTKKKLKDMPVLANVDFGHTTPILTIPLGGKAEIDGDKLRLIG